MADVRSTVRSVMSGDLTLRSSLAVGVAVGAASLTMSANGSALDRDVALAGMATFLFGVLLAFTIARAREWM